LKFHYESKENRCWRHSIKTEQSDEFMNIEMSLIFTDMLSKRC